MSRRALSPLAVCFAAGMLAAALAGAAAPDIRDTRMLTEPAISADRIAFVYAGDLWTCDLSGGAVRRITSDTGIESSPAFSPDGKWIAYSARIDGNTDVYLVPAEGGVPRRLTWHPGADVAQGFTPDGKYVLLTSPRGVYTSRYTQLFRVPVEGGPEELVAIPNANRAAYSPDGTHLAYNPGAPQFQQWKRYRGGAVSEIWIYDPATRAVEKVPQPATRANDAGPMWIGQTVYFRSDRDGEFNLYSFDPKSKAIRRLTSHADFPVLNASAGAGKIVYEQAGYLHLFDPANGADKRLAVGVAADLPETRPRFVKETKERKYIREFSLSPSGVRVAMDFRGEILTVPAEKGDVRNLTNTPGVHERSPIWSPDGRSIAYFSDESGEYQLHVAAQDGKGEPKKWKLSGAGFYESPSWSPDSKRIAYVDNARALYWFDLASGTSKKVAADYYYGPIKTLRPAWSPDSRWLAYAVNNHALLETISVYSVDQDKSFLVTDGLSDASQPVFDRSGKYLFFLASTNAGPANNWFTLENQDYRVANSIYLAVLRKDLPNPLPKESDEEKAAEAKSEDKKGAAADEKKKEDSAKKTDIKSDEKPKAPPVVEAVKIDFDGLSSRILDLPIPAAQISNLQAGPEGQVFYLRTADEKTALMRFDLKERKSEPLLPDIEDYEISADGKKLLYHAHDDWAIVSASAKKIEAGEGKLKTAGIEVRIDPRAEWAEMYEDAWRINRDYFYDPHMHGLDWKAIHDKYAQFLPHLAVRQDLNRVMQWMMSELSVGHSFIIDPGDPFVETTTVPGGLLGADYAVENGRYRFAKVYGGLNWNPELRSPLTEPGVNVKTGEYLLAVGGRDVKPPANLYSFFENTSGKLIEITVGPTPDGKGSRTVPVVPIASELQLRNRDWVESNIRKVDAATNGRVAYVWVPNTADLGWTYFTRYFYPQAYKDAVILDERYNGGGSVADYYIDVLQKKLIAYWVMRYGNDMKTPSGSVQGPKVMIADENAGSGGDLLPWMWRKFQVGPIVGKRTWGGLVGILGFPDLMDGGSVTAPNIAFWDPDKGWAVENEGVPPDVEVEQTPADVAAGHDPQLERAIAIALEDLKKNPPKQAKRPPFPVKAVPAPATAGTGAGSH